MDYVYKNLLPNHDQKITAIKQILEFANDLKHDLLKIENIKLQEMKYFCRIKPLIL